MDIIVALSAEEGRVRASPPCIHAGILFITPLIVAAAASQDRLSILKKGNIFCRNLGEDGGEQWGVCVHTSHPTPIEVLEGTGWTGVSSYQEPLPLD